MSFHIAENYHSQYKHVFFLQALGGAQTDLTHLEFIYFWIASIIAHASPPDGGSSQWTFFSKDIHCWDAQRQSTRIRTEEEGTSIHGSISVNKTIVHILDNDVLII